MKVFSYNRGMCHRLRLTTALLLAAMLLRSLIPVGFMPNTSGGIAYPLLPCPGGLAAFTGEFWSFTAVAGRSNGKHKADRDDKNNMRAPCPYTGTLASTVLSAPVLPLMPGLSSGRVPATPVVTALRSRRPVGPRLSRAPPLSL